MDKTILKYDKSVRDAQISFYRIQNEFNEYYSLPQVQISPINNKFKFILGLNFICSSKGNMLINSNYGYIFQKNMSPQLNLSFSSSTKSRYAIRVACRA